MFGKCGNSIRQIQWSAAVRKHISTNTIPAFRSKLLEQEHIDEAIKLVPNLSIYPTNVWYRAHETFTNHGIETINFLRIVTGNPNVLKRSQQNIVECLEIWHTCQFGERLLHILLTKYPDLLNVNDVHLLQSRMSYLKSRVTTHKNVWKLLMNSPDLVSQSEDSLEEKFNYIASKMRIEVPEIVKSSAMSLPFNELLCRHEFLVRLGLFKPRSPKSDPNEPTTNNRLYQITDTSEKSFAKKICHCTLDEFEAFKELFAREFKGRPLPKASQENSVSDDELD